MTLIVKRSGPCAPDAMYRPDERLHGQLSLHQGFATLAPFDIRELAKLELNGSSSRYHSIVLSTGRVAARNRNAAAGSKRILHEAEKPAYDLFQRADYTR
ncbi:hypothetical protein [Bradyrhizobium sp. CCBAU 65884]|uniref:hypothetical protein n=1 Tax=Bradyrhizobium sp. CCBAU 65884 TaxID=722477 RepID=UPI00230554CE|nr:hypothetical protein [Bradyrhizobium sp. CCBAU 65884]